MSLLSPWGLWWLLSLPLLVTFYLFRPEPRRRPSTTFFLWKTSAPDSQGGVYANRLRGNPLMWLQLLALLLLFPPLPPPSLVAAALLRLVPPVLDSSFVCAPHALVSTMRAPLVL